jgi:hypothetical protein
VGKLREAINNEHPLKNVNIKGKRIISNSMPNVTKAYNQYRHSTRHLTFVNKTITKIFHVKKASAQSK